MNVLRKLVAAFGLVLACASNPAEPSIDRGGKHPDKCAVPGYTVVVSPHTATVQIGEFATGHAAVSNRCAQVVPNPRMTWVSRNAAVGVVGVTTDTVTFYQGIAAGTVYLVATSDGGGSDSTLLTVVAPAGPCTGTATNFCPGDNLQLKINAAGNGTAFTFSPGVYQNQKLTPKTGQSFTGGSGAIMDGGRTLVGFAVRGSNFGIGGQTQQGTVTGSLSCQAAFPMCQTPEQLWRDGVVQTPVASKGALATGKWYFDYATDSIFVRDDPSGHIIQTSVTDAAFTGAANNVTITGLVIQHYDISFGSGAINGTTGTGWTVRGDTLRQNGGVGVRVEAANFKIVSSRLSGNGQFGFSAAVSSGSITGLIVDSTQIDSNNTAGWTVGAAAGGFKVVRTDSAKFRFNWVRKNAGNGMWIDIDNRWTTISNNIVDTNDYQGIFEEISYGARINNNTVRGNGYGRANATCFGAGILVAASPDVEVDHNTLSNNNNGTCAVQQARGSGAYGAHEINNLNVHDNITHLDDNTYAGLSVGTGDATYFTTRGNSFTNNTYYLPGVGNPFTWQFSSRTRAEWQAYGEDATGTFF